MPRPSSEVDRLCGKPAGHTASRCCGDPTGRLQDLKKHCIYKPGFDSDVERSVELACSCSKAIHLASLRGPSVEERIWRSGGPAQTGQDWPALPQASVANREVIHISDSSPDLSLPSSSIFSP